MRYRVTLTATSTHECDCEFCKMAGTTNTCLVYLERSSAAEIESMDGDELYDLYESFDPSGVDPGFEVTIDRIEEFPRGSAIQTEEMIL